MPHSSFSVRMVGWSARRSRDSRRTGGFASSDGRWLPASCPRTSSSMRSSFDAEFLGYHSALSAIGAEKADSECRGRSCQSGRRRQRCFSTTEHSAALAPAQPRGKPAAGRAQCEHLALFTYCAQGMSTWRADRHASARACARAMLCMREPAFCSGRACSHVSLV